MAQLVEHILGKDEVPGPNPGSSSKRKGHLSRCPFLVRLGGTLGFGPAPPRTPYPSTTAHDTRKALKSLSARRLGGIRFVTLANGEYPGSSSKKTRYPFGWLVFFVFGAATIGLGLVFARVAQENRFACPDRRSKSLLFRRRSWVYSPRRIPGEQRNFELLLYWHKFVPMI